VSAVTVVGPTPFRPVLPFPRAAGYRILLILRGIPASGKSTFARGLVNGGPFKRVNRDELREMIDDGLWCKDNERMIVDVQNTIVRKYLSEGWDVVVDNTHITRSSFKALHTLAAQEGGVQVIEKVFYPSLAECLARNDKRQGRAKVSADVIFQMQRKMASAISSGDFKDKETLYAPRGFVKQDSTLPPAIICDLDGTLCLHNGRNPYDAAKCEQDLPNQSVLNCINSMHYEGFKIIFLSGREEKFYDQSVTWIGRHFVSCRYDIYMRPTGDTRPDFIVKRELFEKHVLPNYYVEFILDDRQQVVDEWRRMGLTCFQVAPGDF
jgi:predicted kinase